MLKNVIVFAVALLPGLANAQSSYTCSDYLKDLPDGSAPAFRQAVGFTYGAFYMSNWTGTLLVDEDKLKRFDNSIIANCRSMPDKSFALIALQTAHDYAR